MEKIRTIFDLNLEKERNHALIIYSRFVIIFGLLLMAFYVYKAVCKDITLVDSGILAIGLFLFVIGSILLLIVKKTYKKAKMFNIYTETTFNEDHYLIETFEDEELVATIKVYYNKCSGFIETKNYILITRKVGVVDAITRVDELKELLLSKGIPCKSNKK